MEMPGPARSIIHESTSVAPMAETGNASTAHHQNRSPRGQVPRRAQAMAKRLGWLAGARQPAGGLVIGLRDGVCGFWQFPRSAGGS
jgi:hypothetical protein